jgi:hypothetical protein
MTVPERRNAHPALIHPSRRREPARTAKVRSNSDTSTKRTPPKMQNEPAFHPATGVPAAATLTLRPASSPTSHLAPIEIP